MDLRNYNNASTISKNLFCEFHSFLKSKIGERVCRPFPSTFRSLSEDHFESSRQCSKHLLVLVRVHKPWTNAKAITLSIDHIWQQQVAVHRVHPTKLPLIYYYSILLFTKFYEMSALHLNFRYVTSNQFALQC